MTLLRRASVLALAMLPALAFGAGSKAKNKAARYLKAGQTAFKKHDFAAALKDFEACLKAQPDNDECAGGKSSAEKGLRDPVGRAATAPTSRRTLQPMSFGAPAGNVGNSGGGKGDATKSWNEGILFFQQGQYDKARESWERCAQLDPGNSDCKTGLKRLESAGTR